MVSSIILAERGFKCIRKIDIASKGKVMSPYSVAYHTFGDSILIRCIRDDQGQSYRTSMECPSAGIFPVIELIVTSSEHYFSIKWIGWILICLFFLCGRAVMGRTGLPCGGHKFIDYICHDGIPVFHCKCE